VGIVGCQAIRSNAPKTTHVGGLTMGADPVAYSIAHRSFLDGKPIDAFSVRKRAKDHGTEQRIEGGLPIKARCLIVEDTITTGRSSMEAVAALRAHGAQILGVLCLVNRSDGAEKFYEGQGLPLISIFTGAELKEAARPAAEAKASETKA
jgi:orotate phosphoribosyltransferase